MTNVLYLTAAALGYGLVGLVLMVVGYVLTDLLTPGRLADLIWVNRNRNAAVLLASNLLGVGIIVAMAIFASEEGIWLGLLSTVAYGLVGLVLMALSFLVVDLLTPGKPGTVVAETELHPAVWVSAAAHLAVAFIVAAAIS
ncbi:DUF350 domain-containing protein [Allonocardiopsis opalescens]|uniref:Uncharacterized membrane protein YjfL (UPF0719 family) n=1 Tax=Allonocardiopsis opalescens TaxID=1144618 RepID=A0A2T0QAM5_9ACTN|nr:DUF350 domain-containing protein [Allonocardiopsis opalescens]PRY00875.1 uncharacterized membrane protein YjfL (UPF0719 family) [Allonocardiopsis opalescens]